MFPQCMTEASYMLTSPPPPFSSIAVFGFISKSFAKANLELHFFYNSLTSLYLVSRDNNFHICGLDSEIQRISE